MTEQQHKKGPDNHGGKGITGWIQPICSCGWEGSKHYAHNDYQHYNAREEWYRHEQRDGGD